MPKKVQIKTKKTTASVGAYVSALDSPEAQRDAKTLLKLFKEVTGLKPKMWGESIVGFGKYTYFRKNGDEGEMLATGFSMRKSGPVLYVLNGVEAHASLLDKLGPHKFGKSCLYVKKLVDIDLKVLEKLIRQGLKELKASYDVDMK